MCKNFICIFFLDELKSKIDLKVDDIDHLTLEDIRLEVDKAIGQVRILFLLLHM